MSFIKKLFGGASPSKKEFEHAQFLIRLFEEKEIQEEDIEKFKEICSAEGWDYELKVAEQMKSSLKRRIQDLDGDNSLHVYTDNIDIFQKKMSLFGLQDNLIKQFEELLIVEFYGYFLKQFKRTSKNFLWGIEYEAFKYAVDKSHFGVEQQIANVSIEEMLNVVGLTSIRASAKYIETLLLGNSPRFDIVFNYHKDLIKLVGKCKLAKSEETKVVVYELTEKIYEQIEVYLLSPTADYSEGFFSRKGLFDLTMENMSSIKYIGKWEKELRNTIDFL